MRCSFKLREDCKDLMKDYEFIIAAKDIVSEINSKQKKSSKNTFATVNLYSIRNMCTKAYKLLEKDESLSQVQCIMIALQSSKIYLYEHYELVL